MLPNWEPPRIQVSPSGVYNFQILLESLILRLAIHQIVNNIFSAFTIAALCSKTDKLREMEKCLLIAQPCIGIRVPKQKWNELDWLHVGL